MQFQSLAAGRTLLFCPGAATQILRAPLADAIKLCQGQPWPEMFYDARRILEDRFTEKEWADALGQVAEWGFFEGHPKRSPRVRLFDPAPAMEFLVRRCRHLFAAPTVVALFALLFAGLWQLLGHWGLFLAQLEIVAGTHPLLSIVLFYLCFVPVGLLHELAHGLVCRWFGGEVVEVGLRTNSANLYVLANTAPLASVRNRILYNAGGALLDMLIFFLLVNIWLRWPNYWTFLFLLPQAMFVLLFAYAMENGSDLSRIISLWTGIPEAAGRWAFVKRFFQSPPKTTVQWRRAAIYLGSIALQLLVAGHLIWSVRRPVPVSLGAGFAPKVPFLPVLLFLAYRWLRRGMMKLLGLVLSPK